MRARNRSATAVLILAMLLLRPEPGAAGPDGATRCRMLKLSAIATNVRAQLRCHVRAMGIGMSVVPSCLAGADAKLTHALAHADDVGDCPPDLATARAESAAFVARGLELVAPTPTPTPRVTPSPAFTGCGNGVIEPGEQCDGEAFCSTACGIAISSVCCAQAGSCIGGDFPVLAETCDAQGIPYVLGAVCTPADAACEPGIPCPGACTPEATFPATHVCCALGSGCAEAVADDTVQLWQFFVPTCLQSAGTVAVGRCNPAGACVPGS